jgi:hypothetical protein
MVHLLHHVLNLRQNSPTLDHFHRNQWTNSPEYAVVSIPVQGPHETKRVVETIIACLSDHGQEVLKL